MAALPVVLNVSHFYGEVLKLSLQIMGADLHLRPRRRCHPGSGDRPDQRPLHAPRPARAAGLRGADDPGAGRRLLHAVRPARRVVRQPDDDGGLADRGTAAGPSRLFRRVDQLPRPRRGTHRRLQRAHQGHGRPRGVRPARHDPGRRAADLAHLQAGRFPRLHDARPAVPAHPRAVQHADAHLGRAVRSSAGHPRRAQRLHRLLRAAQEPPVPPAAAGLRGQRRGAGRRRDGDAVLCRTRAEGRQAAGRHHPARLLHRRRRQRAAVADAVEADAARPPPGSSA